MNIDYKFLCIWISSFSLSEYIVKMHLQQYDIASGGQWRPRMYFSWYTSFFILNDGVYDVIESINFSRSSANLQHFSIKCLTFSGSLEQSGQVDSIFLLLRDVDKIFISIPEENVSYSGASYNMDIRIMAPIIRNFFQCSKSARWLQFSYHTLIKLVISP